MTSVVRNEFWPRNVSHIFYSFFGPKFKIFVTPSAWLENMFKILSVSIFFQRDHSHRQIFNSTDRDSIEKLWLFYIFIQTYSILSFLKFLFSMSKFSLKKKNKNFEHKIGKFTIAVTITDNMNISLFEATSCVAWLLHSSHTKKKVFSTSNICSIQNAQTELSSFSSTTNK